MTDENDTPDDDADDVVRVEVRPRRGSKGTGVSTDPVQNDHVIPLFPDAASTDSRHIITKLEVVKLTSPGEGFKGTVAATATLETIGRLFGNGRYNIRAVNDEGRILRRLNDQAINLPPAPESTPASRQTVGQSPDLTLLTFQANQHDKDAARAAALTTQSISQSQALTEKHLSMVEKQAESTATRDRTFFEGMQVQQRDFFASLLAMTDKSHQMTIQVMQLSHERALAASDPTRLLMLFKSGLELGRGLDSDDDDNPFVRGMQVGVTGLKEIKDMLVLKTGLESGKVAPRSLPPSKGATVGKPTEPDKSVKPKSDKPTPETKTDKSDPTDDELRVILGKLHDLKLVLDQKGIDIASYLEQAKEHVATLDDEPEETDTESQTPDENSAGST